MTTESPGKSSDDELAILQKIEAANRLLDQDRKSIKHLRGSLGATTNSKSTHSRKNSDTSSISSHLSNQLSTNDDDSTNSTSAPEDCWVVWGRIIADWDNFAKKKANSLRELVRKGIPHHLRPIVWQLLCGAQNSQSKETYAEFMKMSSPCEKGIRRDIARTYPEHDFFKEKDGLGQESLFNVMKAYSLQDREVGYCQGSGFIVGLLLMQMPEEDAFAVLVQLMQEYRLRELFKPNMMELGLCMYQLEALIQDYMPDLSMHFQSQGFHTSMYASSWFLTLYTTVLPLSLACRVMDLYISEGLEIIFKIGMAILTDNEEDLMGQDMEGMIRYFQNVISSKYEADPERLFNTAYHVKYNSRKMKKLEKEYTAMKTKENEEQVELRRLRTENRLLRQRIDNLEKETGTLADRLIDSQVKQAQAAEEMFIVKRELSGIKQHSSSVSLQLEEAHGIITKLNNGTGNNNGLPSDTIKHLQEELIDLRNKYSQQKSTMQDLHEKIQELEQTNRRLQDEPASEIAAIQEELTASKMREAEGSLALKDLRKHVTELDQCWQQHLDRISSKHIKEKTSKSVVQQLHDNLMTAKLRDAESLAELKELKQKVMELETQNHICSHQMRRISDESRVLKESIEEGLDREKSHKEMNRGLERKISDMETKEKECAMMSRIKNAEHSQGIAEMRQRIAELEIQNQELVTAGQLRGQRAETRELENRIVELQHKVLSLRMNKNLPKMTHSENGGNSDSDQDEDEDGFQHALKDAKYYLPSDSDSGSVNSLHRLELQVNSVSSTNDIQNGSHERLNGALTDDIATETDDVTVTGSNDASTNMSPRKVDIVSKFDNITKLSNTSSVLEENS